MNGAYFTALDKGLAHLNRRQTSDETEFQRKTQEIADKHLSRIRTGSSSVVSGLRFPGHEAREYSKPCVW